ncbi:hypothetical protein PSHT_03947 [Puccinia striiformis]|uniref:Uncharacterized protein n=1 Tax=Puccinia striiformis TaxID=27350 RepID=A0A2S4WEA7_9BASI|nr:hypothetical protein PSHT_03947 [Puccinia striiformis]
MMMNYTLMIALWFTCSMAIQGKWHPSKSYIPSEEWIGLQGMEDLTLSLTQTVYYQAQYEWWSLDLLDNGHLPETAQHMREVKAKELHIHTARIVTSHGKASTETEWGGHDYRSVTYIAQAKSR